jgi:hypothetical protein
MTVKQLVSEVERISGKKITTFDDLRKECLTINIRVSAQAEIEFLHRCVG